MPFPAAPCLRYLITAALCGLLTGCLATQDAILSPPVSSPPATVTEHRPTSASLPKAVAPAPLPANLDFRIVEARATIDRREYTMERHNRPVITSLGDDTYRLDLTLTRASRSSLRGDETLRIHFYYDGLELIFFGDRNDNRRLDRREPSMRYLINHTREIVTKGDRRYIQPLELNVTLKREHITSAHSLRSLDMSLIFQAGR